MGIAFFSHLVEFLPIFHSVCVGFLEGFGGWDFGRSEEGVCEGEAGWECVDVLHDCVEGVGEGKRGGGKDISCF